MNKKTFIKKYCPNKWIMEKNVPKELDDKWLADLDQLINSVKEECADVAFNDMYESLPESSSSMEAQERHNYTCKIIGERILAIRSE